MESATPFGTTSPKVEPPVVLRSWICAANGQKGGGSFLSMLQLLLRQGFDGWSDGL